MVLRYSTTAILSNQSVCCCFSSHMVHSPAPALFYVDGWRRVGLWVTDDRASSSVTWLPVPHRCRALCLLVQVVVPSDLFGFRWQLAEVACQSSAPYELITRKSWHPLHLRDCMSDGKAHFPAAVCFWNQLAVRSQDDAEQDHVLVVYPSLS